MGSTTTRNTIRENAGGSTTRNQIRNSRRARRREHPLARMSSRLHLRDAVCLSAGHVQVTTGLLSRMEVGASLLDLLGEKEGRKVQGGVFYFSPRGLGPGVACPLRC